jgi:tetratricopeptide (TPR) repeat protein
LCKIIDSAQLKYGMQVFCVCQYTKASFLKSTLPYLLLLLIALYMAACAPKDTVTSRAYHNITAHYNGYYYAREEVLKIEQTIRKSHVDDYNRILRIFPLFDSTLAKSYDKEIQESIKMASLAIQHHPNSKWVDDAYILVGKARLYSLDWGNAIQTFKFVNNPKLTKNKDARHKALIVLVRTFTEHKEYNNAQAAIDYLEKQELNKENKKDFALEKALFHQVQGDYDKMVRDLAEADPYLTKKDRKGRIYFILGQVYQKLGFESEAYNYYKKCLATNPEYEVDFYARLYLAQVTEISRSRNVSAARKSFRKLLKDRKNKDFQDKIYYEMGMFELKQKNLKQAIEDFNLSIRTGSNSRIDGESFLRLGIIYYDTLKQYEKSQAYYDSAIAVLPKDYDNYAKIKARQEVLNDFVKNLKTIQWQDSLLELAALDTTALRARIASVVEAKKKLEEEAAAANKKKKSRVEIASTRSTFGNSDEEAPAIATEGEGSEWYFGNVSAISIGQSEFKRVWGSVALEDNWRRSGRGNTQQGAAPGPEVTNAQDPNANTPAPEVKAEDPVEAEYARIDKEIPRTEEQRAAALKKIEDAYFQLGDIYYFKLEETNNAIETYVTMLNRFPETEYEPEVLYKLYLMSKDQPAQADQYASMLKEKHPNSTFARILANPDYLKESGEAAEKQKKLYKIAYESFQQGNYPSAKATIAEAEAMGETAFKPRLDLLKILITGETDDLTRYQFELEEYIKTYPDGELTPYAKKLLASSRELTLSQEKSQVGFVKSFEEPHYFVIVYQKADKLSEPASADLEKFNEQYFKDLKLKTSNLILDDARALTMVTELPDLNAASAYRRTFVEKLNTLAGIKNQKFNSFVITKDNFNIFYRTKGLDEYIQFFEKNYPAKNP